MTNDEIEKQFKEWFSIYILKSSHDPSKSIEQDCFEAGVKWMQEQQDKKRCSSCKWFMPGRGNTTNGSCMSPAKSNCSRLYDYPDLWQSKESEK